MTSEENQAIQDSHEKIFKNRYSEDDPGYMKLQNSSVIGPPCVINCFTKQKRSHSNMNDNRQLRQGYDDRNRGYNINRIIDYHNNRGFENRHSRYRNHDHELDKGNRGYERDKK